MEQYHAILLRAPLFAGFSAAELAQLLPQLSPQLRHCQKGEALLHAGSGADALGIVLEGQLEAVKFTQAGGQFTVAQIGPGGVFGDVLSAGHNKSPVTVYSTGPALVMLLPAGRLFAPPPGAPAALYHRLLGNLADVISAKYFALNARVDLLLIKSLRRRIAAYLLSAEKQPGQPFSIPFNRTQLAHYLGCERSALSREISRMAADGLLESRRSTFRLVNADALRHL